MPSSCSIRSEPTANVILRHPLTTDAQNQGLAIHGARFGLHGRLLLTRIAGRRLSDHIFEPGGRFEFGEVAASFLLVRGHQIGQLAPSERREVRAWAIPRARKNFACPRSATYVIR
jgi:hypothetical protein